MFEKFMAAHCAAMDPPQPVPFDCVARFDCRVSAAASMEGALAVLLWRAHDCSFNGISDAVFERSNMRKEGVIDVLKIGSNTVHR